MSSTGDRLGRLRRAWQRLKGLGRGTTRPSVAAGSHAAVAASSSSPSAGSLEAWPVELFALLAGDLVDMHRARRQWRHRKVETIEWLGESLYRRHVSVDFTMPAKDQLPNYWSTLRRFRVPTAIIPLIAMRKGVLYNFDLMDESGRAIPVLTRDQHELIAVVAVLTEARSALHRSSPSNEDRPEAVKLHPTLQTRISGIVRQNDPVVARTDFDALRDCHSTDAADVADLASYTQQRCLLVSDDQFTKTLEEFAERYLMCICLGVSAGQRRVVKYSYEDRSVTHVRAARWQDRLGILFERVLMGLAWLPRITRVQTGQPSSAQSYHVEVAAPSDLLIARADLVVPHAGKKSEVVRSESLARRVHFHVPSGAQRRNADAGLSAFDSMNLEVHFALEPYGYLLSVLLVGAGTFLLLFSGLLWHAHGAHLAPGDTAAVVVVALPGLLAALMFRSDQEMLVALSVRGLRVLVGFLVAASLGAAGLLALQLDTTTRQWGWIVAIVVAGLAAASTYVAWCCSLCWARVASGRDRKVKGPDGAIPRTSPLAPMPRETIPIGVAALAAILSLTPLRSLISPEVWTGFFVLIVIVFVCTALAIGIAWCWRSRSPSIIR